MSLGMKSVIWDKLQMKQAIINRNNQHKKTLWATRIQRRSLILRDKIEQESGFTWYIDLQKGSRRRTSIDWSKGIREIDQVYWKRRNYSRFHLWKTFSERFWPYYGLYFSLTARWSRKIKSIGGRGPLFCKSSSSLASY